MTLCYDLSEIEVDDEPETQRLERQDLFISRADQLLRPLFRYCQYELKQAGMTPVQEPKAPSSVGTVGGASSASSPEDTITFRGAELVLDSKELRVLLLKLQSVEQDEEGHDHGKSGESQFLAAVPWGRPAQFCWQAMTLTLSPSGLAIVNTPLRCSGLARTVDCCPMCHCRIA